MMDSGAAVAADRLPWLSDDPRPRPDGGSRHLLGWLVAAGAAILLVAAVSYWLGQRSADRTRPAAIPSARTAPTTTVPLPQARAVPHSEPQVQAEPMPQVAAPAPPPLPLPREAAPAPTRTRELKTVPADAADDTGRDQDWKPDIADQTTAETPAVAKSNEHPDRPWPVRVTDGASGRLVRVGAFTSSRQAKKAWWAMMRNNPALKRLPALVVPAPSLRDGRTYYRLQMGTTSQAHSEVLCQRMRRIGQSCVVIEVYNRGEGSAS